jgi:hypothetical protein
VKQKNGHTNTTVTSTRRRKKRRSNRNKTGIKLEQQNHRNKHLFFSSSHFFLIYFFDWCMLENVNKQKTTFKYQQQPIIKNNTHDRLFGQISFEKIR